MMRFSSLLRYVAVFLVVVSAALVSSPELAFGDDKAEAVKQIQIGNQAYDAGDFRKALNAYRRAYDLTEDPRVLYRIGLTYENLANYQRAREHLELFLLAEPDSQYAGRVKRKIDNLRKLEANLQAAVRVSSQPPGAEVFVDDEQSVPVGTTPLRVPLGPGSHTLTLKLQGFEPLRDTVELEAGETLEKSYELAGGAEVADAQEAPEPERLEEPVEEPVPEPTSTRTVSSNHQVTRVNIAPPPSVAVLSWIGVIGGTTFALIGLVASPAVNEAAAVMLIGGSAALIAGGYFLWVKDWTTHLRPASMANESPAKARTLGIGISF